MKTALGEQLARLTAVSHALYYKTKAAHWTVRGPLFYELHKMLDEVAETFHDAVDELAERAVQIGFAPPLGLAEVLSLSEVRDRKKGTPADRAALEELLADADRATALYRTAVALTDEVEDPASNDLLAGLERAHEKAAWLLRQTLSGGAKADLV